MTVYFASIHFDRSDKMTIDHSMVFHSPKDRAAFVEKFIGLECKIFLAESSLDINENKTPLLN